MLFALQLYLAPVNVPAHMLGCYMQSWSGPCRLSTCTLWSSLVVTTYPRILCHAPCAVPSLLPAVFLVPSSPLLCSPVPLTHLAELQPCLFYWRTWGFHNFWWTCLLAPTRALLRILYKSCVYPPIHGCHPKGKHGTCIVKDLLSGRSISHLSREQHTMAVLSKPKDAGIMKCFLSPRLLSSSIAIQTVST